METLKELGENGMSLAQIKKAMRDWIWHTRPSMSDAVKEYKEFIAEKRESVKNSNQTSGIIRDRLAALDKIEKCMDYHLEWGFTMGIVKKFEKKNKAAAKIQSRHRGNMERTKDYTAHWKGKNKKRVMAALLEEMIEKDMGGAEQAEIREQIRVFLREKGFASKKKQIVPN